MHVGKKAGLQSNITDGIAGDMEAGGLFAAWDEAAMGVEANDEAMLLDALSLLPDVDKVARNTLDVNNVGLAGGGVGDVLLPPSLLASMQGRPSMSPLMMLNM
jgi:hypothetical protein